MELRIPEMSLSPDNVFEAQIAAARKIDISSDGPNVVLLQQAIAYLSKIERGKEAVIPPGSRALIEALKRDPGWRQEVMDMVFPIPDADLSPRDRFAKQVRAARRIDIHDRANHAMLRNAIRYLRRMKGAETDYHPDIPSVLEPLIEALKQDEEWREEVEKVVERQALG